MIAHSVSGNAFRKAQESYSITKFVPGKYPMSIEHPIYRVFTCRELKKIAGK